MNDEIKQILQKNYEALPYEVQLALQTTDIRGILSHISQAHSLRIDQAGMLEDEVMYVMLGLESPDDFVDNLEKELSLTHDTAMNIAHDVDAELFQVVRHAMMQEDSSQDTSVIKEEPLAPGVEKKATATPEKTPTLQNPPRSLPGDIARMKLEQMIHTQETPLKPDPEAPVEKRYPATDPYREPVE